MGRNQWPMVPLWWSTHITTWWRSCFERLHLRTCMLPWVETTLVIYIYIYLSWYVSVVSVWILLDMLLVHNEYLFESAVFVNAAKRHQLPTIPWLDSVEYIVSQVLKKVHINVVWIPSEEDISMWKKIWPLPYIWRDCVLWLQLMDMMTILFYAVLYRLRFKEWVVVWQQSCLAQP